MYFSDSEYAMPLEIQMEDVDTNQAQDQPVTSPNEPFGIVKEEAGPYASGGRGAA